MATLSQLTLALSPDGRRVGKTFTGFDLGGLVSQLAGGTSRGNTARPGRVRVRANDHAILSIDGTFAIPPVIGSPSIDLPAGTELDVNLEGAPVFGAGAGIRGVFTQVDLGGTIDLRVEEGA